MTGRNSHEMFMEAALEEAGQALLHGEFPVGCVIVDSGVVLVSSGRKNSKNANGGETRHAEIIALENLEERYPGRSRKNMTIYCTMEPCLMCFSAIVLAGIRTVVFAYEDVMGGGTGLYRQHLSPLYRDAQITVVAHVLRKKSLDLFYNFFNNGHNLYWKDSLLESYTLDQWDALGG